MGNFKSIFATDNRVESGIHLINKFVRMATNQLKENRLDSDYFVMRGGYC